MAWGLGEVKSCVNQKLRVDIQIILYVNDEHWLGFSSSIFWLSRICTCSALWNNWKTSVSISFGLLLSNYNTLILRLLMHKTNSTSYSSRDHQDGLASSPYLPTPPTALQLHLSGIIFLSPQPTGTYPVLSTYSWFWRKINFNLKVTSNLWKNK